MKLGIRACAAMLATIFSTLVAQAQPDSLWSRTFGTNNYDYYRGMVRTSDNGWAVCGTFHEALGQQSNVWFARLDHDFNLLWQHELDFGAREDANGIIQTADSGFVLVMDCSSIPPSNYGGVIVAKFDGAGERIWATNLDEAYFSRANSIILRPNGELVVSGSWFNIENPAGDLCLWVLDPNGDLRETIHFGDESYEELLYSMINTTEGGLALVGRIDSLNEDARMVSSKLMFMKFDDGYSATWVKLLGDGEDSRWGSNLVQLTGGGYAIVCNIDTLDDPGEYYINPWLIMTDVNGENDIAYRVNIGESAHFNGILEVDGGDLLVVGSSGSYQDSTGSNCCLMNLSQEGEILWQTRFSGMGNDYGIQVFQTNDNGYLIGGTTSSIGARGNNVWLLMTSNDPASVTIDHQGHSSLYTLHSAFPNPFNSSTTISYDVARPGFVRLRVYDALGRLVGTVKEGYASPGSYRAVWNGADLPGGKYHFRLEGSESNTASAIFLK